MHNAPQHDPTTRAAARAPLPYLSAPGRERGSLSFLMNARYALARSGGEPRGGRLGVGAGWGALCTWILIASRPSGGVHAKWIGAVPHLPRPRTRIEIGAIYASLRLKIFKT